MKEKKMSITIIFLLLFISSCGLLDGKTKEEKTDEYFRAELNGKAVEFDDQLAIIGSPTTCISEAQKHASNSGE
tara:strand:- start:11141 stop:11362 length:222 start_codon:yes stop_codon:yes gene_type:complete